REPAWHGTPTRAAGGPAQRPVAATDQDLVVLLGDLAAAGGDHLVHHVAERQDAFFQHRIVGREAAMFENAAHDMEERVAGVRDLDRKSTRLNSSNVKISYAAYRLKKKA